MTSTPNTAPTGTWPLGRVVTIGESAASVRL